MTLQFLLSRPCGNLGDSYVSRTNDINVIYKINQCNYDKDGNNQHTLFYPTNMTQLELAVYRDNDFIKTIGDYVPNPNVDEFINNNYTLYYRPYSLWKTEC